MKQLLILMSFIGFFNCCSQVDMKCDTPNCIEEKIEAYKSSKNPCPSGKSVYRYTFQEKHVYVFNPGNCGADMMSDVYDENCNLICGLGGIAGNQNCLEENFGENASEETLIWKN